MLMPLLVRLTDPQIEMADGVVSQVPDAVDDGSRIFEQVRAAGLPIHKEALLPDLDVKPLHRDVEPGGQLRDAEQAGIVVPAGALPGRLEPGTQADPLHRDGADLLRAVGRAIPSAVRIAAISSSARPAPARSSRRSRISAPRVRRASELTFIFTSSSLTAPPRHTILTTRS